jgi:hypothetical protein
MAWWERSQAAVDARGAHLKASIMRAIMGTMTAEVEGQPASFMKAAKRLGVMAVGVVVDTCKSSAL